MLSLFDFASAQHFFACSMDSREFMRFCDYFEWLRVCVCVCLNNKCNSWLQSTSWFPPPWLVFLCLKHRHKCEYTQFNTKLGAHTHIVRLERTLEEAKEQWPPTSTCPRFLTILSSNFRHLRDGKNCRKSKTFTKNQPNQGHFPEYSSWGSFS